VFAAALGLLLRLAAVPVADRHPEAAHPGRTAT
jgi:hypothetical protein